MIVLALVLLVPLAKTSAQSKVTVHWWHIFTNPKSTTDYAHSTVVTQQMTKECDMARK
jgi:hypothetical protein